MTKKHMFFSEKIKLEEEYLKWCEEQNKEIHGGRIDDKSFITVISFLQSIGWGNIKELESENAELREKLEKIERDREFCEKEKIKEIFYEFIWAVKNLGHDALIRHLCFMVKAYCPQNIKLFVDI